MTAFMSSSLWWQTPRQARPKPADSATLRQAEPQGEHRDNNRPRQQVQKGDHGLLDSTKTCWLRRSKWICLPLPELFLFLLDLVLQKVNSLHLCPSNFPSQPGKTKMANE